jgi:RNA polymerase sigma-70 factor, ECF subfamily
MNRAIDRTGVGVEATDRAVRVTDGGPISSHGRMAKRSVSEARMDELFAELRRLLFSIAYRMLGSATEAEDIVQEAYLRFLRETSAGTRVESPKAYLSAVATRLSIDHLRSARVRRESYVGTWLPEPLITDEDAETERNAEVSDSLSMGFLVLLETLTPVERAVFLLREVFEYDYAEIASIVGKNEANCRQVAVRARRQVQAGRPRFEASKAQREELAHRFFEAAAKGDVEGLVGMLAADVVAYADGGGKATAFPRPVHGRERVARLLQGGAARGVRLFVASMRLAEINGQPGALFFDPDGVPVVAVSLDIADGQVQTLRAVTNPDKLAHLRTATSASAEVPMRPWAPD